MESKFRDYRPAAPARQLKNLISVIKNIYGQDSRDGRSYRTQPMGTDRQIIDIAGVPRFDESWGICSLLLRLYIYVYLEVHLHVDQP